LERALTRELREEAGLAPLTPPTLISTAHRRSPRGTPLHEHTFRVDAAGRTTLSHEHDAFCLWQPGEQAPGKLTESAAALPAFAEAACGAPGPAGGRRAPRPVGGPAVDRRAVQRRPSSRAITDPLCGAGHGPERERPLRPAPAWLGVVAHFSERAVDVD